MPPGRTGWWDGMAACAFIFSLCSVPFLPHRAFVASVIVLTSVVLLVIVISTDKPAW
jgi:hypothetical protein